MSFEKKYLKYKNKYLNLKKLIGGAKGAESDAESDAENDAENDDDTPNYTESEILQNYTRIPNKGTQNCGVFINKSEGNKILICDKNIFDIDIDKIEFLSKNENIYPQLYDIYYATDTNKIFYLWEKMDGDLRDFIFEHIPRKILKNNNCSEQEIATFIEFIAKKAYTDVKIYFTAGEKIKFFHKKLNGSAIETPHLKGSFTSLSRHDSITLMHKSADKEKFDEITSFLIRFMDVFNSKLSRPYFINKIILEITSEIEYQLNNMIKIITKKRYNMYKKGYYFSDKKFDNIVFQINNVNGKEEYDFFLIDPSSSLNKIMNKIIIDRIVSRGLSPSKQEEALKELEKEKRKEALNSILYDFNTKYDNFKVTDNHPSIYENYLESLFKTIEIDDCHIEKQRMLYYHYILDSYNKSNGNLMYEIATMCYKITKSNVLSTKINTEEELLHLLSN
jgi:hypothetical protein